MGPGKWRCVGFLLLCTLASVHAQGPSPEEKIPIERCDLLPVVLVRIEGTNMRFLLDTAATTMLNIKSFSKGRSKKIQVSSWNGTAATSTAQFAVDESGQQSRINSYPMPPGMSLSLGNASSTLLSRNRICPSIIVLKSPRDRSISWRALAN